MSRENPQKFFDAALRCRYSPDVSAIGRRRAKPSLGPLALRGLGILIATLGIGVFLWVSLRRIRYPLDLEWMESGMMCHALRLLKGQGIYVPPSVDFIPHLYTPLYPALVALIGKLSGDVTYLAARLLSLGSFLCALTIGVLWIRREGGSLVCGLLAMAIPAVTFAETGGFFDLARADSLQLGLTVLGAYLASISEGRTRVTVAAGLALVAGFFAKQTAAPLGVGIGLALLLWDRRQAVVLGLVGVLGFVIVSGLVNRASDGWFWTYIFRLHQSHPFFAHRAYVETPKTLIAIVGPSLLLCLWAAIGQWKGRLGERSGRGLWFALWLGLCGMATSCLGFGTQWAHTNAYIPGVFFLSLAIGVCAGRLWSRPGRSVQESGAKLLRELIVLFLLSLSVLLPLGRLRVAEHIPHRGHFSAAASLLDRLRAMPGEVLMPFHPFYPHLVGKRTYLHRMGVWDVRGTVAGPVKDLFAALREKRFSHIVMDDKVEATWADWPDVLLYYRVSERFDGPKVVEGAKTVPSLVLTPMDELSP